MQIGLVDRLRGGSFFAYAKFMAMDHVGFTVFYDFGGILNLFSVFVGKSLILFLIGRKILFILGVGKVSFVRLCRVRFYRAGKTAVIKEAEEFKRWLFIVFKKS